MPLHLPHTACPRSCIAHCHYAGVIQLVTLSSQFTEDLGVRISVGKRKRFVIVVLARPGKGDDASKITPMDVGEL